MVNAAPRNVILQGHVLDRLRELPDACVQCIVTSPPYYGLRAYNTEPQVWGGVSTCQHVWGEKERSPWVNGLPGPHGRNMNVTATRERSKTAGTFCCSCGAWCGELGQEPTPALFIAHLVQVFRECGRVLRHDGTLWVNLGDSYAASGHGGGGGSISEHRNQNQLCGGAKSQKAPEGFLHKSMMLIPHRFAIAMIDEGWILRSDIVWEKPNAMPESIQDRTTKSHEYIFLFTKRPRYFYDAVAIAEPTKYGSCGSQFTTGKTGHHANQGKSQYTYQPTKNARSVWSIPTQPYTEAHFATFPPVLAERMILAGSAPQVCDTCGASYCRQTAKTTSFQGGSARAGRTPEEINVIGKWAGMQYGKTLKSGPVNTVLTTGWTPTCHCPQVNIGRSLVLDPFSGAGTVALVARRLGRDYMGIELNPAYVAMAEERILRDTLPLAMKATPRDLIPPRLFDESEAI